ncbi:ATP-binding protein [Streptomyces sp. NPDC000994]
MQFQNLSGCDGGAVSALCCRLSSVIARYSKINLACLDEFGCLNLDRKGAQLLLQIFTEREERKATAVATTSPFTEWDKTFRGARLCAAIADRIAFRCTLVQTGTESYRPQGRRSPSGPPVQSSP